MNDKLMLLTLIGLALIVATVFAALIGAVAGLLARLGGADAHSSLLRATAAFGGALTVLIAVLALVAGVLAG
ncbi:MULTISPECIES: hypothetical protein [unclassified Streptomyces]|uniref:hypothetical protein n=1 Tax=unclassified Streptomyces TaxID=2593676 RepID=UPI003369E222